MNGGSGTILSIDSRGEVISDFFLACYVINGGSRSRLDNHGSARVYACTYITRAALSHRLRSSSTACRRCINSLYEHNTVIIQNNRLHLHNHSALCIAKHVQLLKLHTMRV